MARRVLYKGEMKCPVCKEIIYRWFVVENGKCPSCGAKIRVSSGKQSLAVG